MRVVDGVLGPEKLRKLLQEPAGLGIDLDIAHQIGIGMLGFSSLTSASICWLFAPISSSSSGFGWIGGVPRPPRPAAGCCGCWATAIPTLKITTTKLSSLFIC